MDFRGRSTPSRAAATPAASNNDNGASVFGGHQLDKIEKLGKQPVGKLFKLGSVFLLFSVTALVIFLTFLLAFSGDNPIGAVDKNKYQAVFLNNGQVYFGNIKGITDKNFDLQNIYYLQTNGENTNTQASTSSDVSLVKLGCELHAPLDQMLINSDQIIFWENLQDSGQVVKAINDYKKQNATGACASTSASTQQAPSTQTATPSPSPTPTPTKKP